MCCFYDRPWCFDDIEECFDDIDDMCRYDLCLHDSSPRYLTTTRDRNGVRIQERIAVPRHRSAWRRRLGASYYPSRYYSRSPRGYYGSPLPARPRSPAIVHRPHIHRHMHGGRAVMPSAHNMVSAIISLFTSHLHSVCTRRGDAIWLSNPIGRSAASTLTFLLSGCLLDWESLLSCCRLGPNRACVNTSSPPPPTPALYTPSTHNDLTVAIPSPTWFSNITQSLAITTSSLRAMASEVSTPTQASKQMAPCLLAQLACWAAMATG